MAFHLQRFLTVLTSAEQEVRRPLISAIKTSSWVKISPCHLQSLLVFRINNTDILDIFFQDLYNRILTTPT